MSSPVGRYARRVYSLWGSGEFRPDKPNPSAVLSSRQPEAPTRLAIVALLALKGPMTVKQISEELDLSPSTVLGHVRRLVEAGVLREVKVPEKRYKRERYYDVAVVVYTDEDEKLIWGVVRKYADILGETAGAVLEKCLEELKGKFGETLMARHGLTLEDHEVRHYVWVRLYEGACEVLEARGVLKSPLSTPRRWYYYIGLRGKG